MPFTAAHPVLILPFRRYGLSTTALVAGSVVPDFEFFAQLREVENIGHQWYGIILFDLPAALFGCLIFHLLIRDRLLANLPPYFRLRFVYAQHVQWLEYAAANKGKILLSVLVGVVSHLLWDGFTHFDGFFVESITTLTNTVSVHRFNFPVYFLLQIVFSVMGMLIILYAIHKKPKQQEAQVTGAHCFFWPSILLVFLLILLVRLYAWPVFNTFWGVVMAILGAAYYALLLVSIVFHFKQQKELSL